jgi:hypothetical protein
MRDLNRGIAGFLLVCTVALSGCTLTRVARGWMQSKSTFTQCTSDARVWCEPGSEVLANSITAGLPQAIASIEKAQFAKITGNILIYTYASPESFVAHTGCQLQGYGCVTLAKLNLSPRLLTIPDHIQALVTHELSHLQLHLQLGTLGIASIPNWFSEGLATLVSGGGAETVTTAQAAQFMAQGKRMVPEDSVWILAPLGGSPYGLGSQMYYRQACMFVGYMRQSNSIAFEKLLRALQANAPFKQAVEAAYGRSVADLWAEFLKSVSREADVVSRSAN